MTNASLFIIPFRPNLFVFEDYGDNLLATLVVTFVLHQLAFHSSCSIHSRSNVRFGHICSTRESTRKLELEGWWSVLFFNLLAYQAGR
jgi:hypothetical protein